MNPLIAVGFWGGVGVVGLFVGSGFWVVGGRMHHESGIEWLPAGD